LKGDKTEVYPALGTHALSPDKNYQDKKNDARSKDDISILGKPPVINADHDKKSDQTQHNPVKLPYIKSLLGSLKERSRGTVNCHDPDKR
jgi:hypothetical protein